MDVVISGIQQIGIGVSDAEKAWAWYRKNFGMNVPVFKDTAKATLMTRYTGSMAHDRYAILALNMQGGGGFEIWQYTSRDPQAAAFKPILGDTGVFAVKMKSRDILGAYNHVKANGAHLLTGVQMAPDGRKHFYLQDPFNNIFEIVESESWFKAGSEFTGGVAGCVIGVNDIDKALKLYSDVLGYGEVISDATDNFSDLHGVPGGDGTFRRVLLRANKHKRGAFSRLLGVTEIELVEVKDREPKKIFENRYWGDLGYIHICFDVNGMMNLAKKCEQAGFGFTVDSNNSFDMGKAAGHFTYCEDPDGTLIEFVETHKIPIIEKLGWYLSLKKRNPEKPLPNWIVGMLSLNRVKD